VPTPLAARVIDLIRNASVVNRVGATTVPMTNLTVGTSTDASYVFTADWSQLAIGMRTGFNIRFLDQRYVADTLSYAWLAYLRADVQLFQPAAFNVDRGVRA
jgi:HK97 family phage major capsid protein